MATLADASTFARSINKIVLVAFASTVPSSAFRCPSQKQFRLACPLDPPLGDQ
jgi:hypothetical protein